jgi:hypothetical protein
VRGARETRVDCTPAAAAFPMDLRPGHPSGLTLSVRVHAGRCVGGARGSCVGRGGSGELWGCGAAHWLVNAGCCVCRCSDRGGCGPAEGCKWRERGWCSA